MTRMPVAILIAAMAVAGLLSSPVDAHAQTNQGAPVTIIPVPVPPTTAPNLVAPTTAVTAPATTVTPTTIPDPATPDETTPPVTVPITTAISAAFVWIAAIVAIVLGLAVVALLWKTWRRSRQERLMASLSPAEPLAIVEPAAPPEAQQAARFEVVEMRYHAWSIGSETLSETVTGPYPHLAEAVESARELRQAFEPSAVVPEAFWIVRRPGQLRADWIADSWSTDEQVVDLRNERTVERTAHRERPRNQDRVPSRRLP